MVAHIELILIDHERACDPSRGYPSYRY
jgi:hypothetical protein